MELRVGTYNIRHGLGMDGRVDLERVGRVIREMELDVIGLQEVDRFWKRSSWEDQAAELAKMTGMDHCFGPAMQRGTSQYGNAVLSRYNICSWEALRMPSLRESRGFLHTIIDAGGNRFAFCNTHLGLSRGERMDHIRRIILPALGTGPVVLAGDFNSRPESPEVILLGQHLHDSLPPVGFPTFPADFPRDRIDYVMYSRGFELVSAEVVQQQASDHHPLLVSIKIV